MTQELRRLKPYKKEFKAILKFDFRPSNLLSRPSMWLELTQNKHQFA